MFSLILLSAGKGLRAKKSMPKQYLSLCGKPLIVHVLDNVDKLKEVNEIIIVAESNYFDLINQYIKKYNITKCVKLVEGGATRQESVYKGLLHASNDSVIIHESARPFVKLESFEQLIECQEENVTFTYPISYTVLIKDENDYISELLNRDELVNIQLPQKFNKADLLKCHKLAIEQEVSFTEDSSMIKYFLNKRVYCCKGESYNIKITEFTDLVIGEIIYKQFFLNEVSE